MKRFLLVLLLAIVALAAVLLIRATTLSSRQITVTAAPPLAFDHNPAAGRLARAVQFRTVSYSAGANGPREHDAFVAWLDATYPRVHAALTREVVNGRSLLYTWRGSDPSLPPLLLMGHYDVVPVEPGTEGRWTHAPFSGDVADGFIWGRGTLDDKSTVVGLFEAAELLLASNWRPRRTILFAFGHDEELGGVQGATRIAALLRGRGVKLDAVLDEGGAITTGMTPGVTRPVALVGVAEKGMLSLELSSTGKGGHSSMPPPRTEVGTIAAAVDRLQNRPFDASVRGATREMFDWLAPEMSFGPRLVMSNLWLFAPLLKRQARSSHSLNAMLRTTIAPTIIEGGVKDNVIPAKARAVVNFRILPGDTVASVTRHVRDAIDDAHVKVHGFGGFAQEPSQVSESSSPQFRALQRTIREVSPDVLVAPYLVIGATDARHYQPLSSNLFRFSAIRVNEADLARIHGTNERVSVDSFADAIRFYHRLMQNAAR